MHFTNSSAVCGYIFENNVCKYLNNFIGVIMPEKTNSISLEFFVDNR